jgi:hypothetical protein
MNRSVSKMVLKGALLLVAAVTVSSAHARLRSAEAIGQCLDAQDGVRESATVRDGLERLQAIDVLVSRALSPTITIEFF